MKICLFVSFKLVLHKLFLLTVSFYTAGIVLIISALPFPFLVGSYVATIIIFGETFDATSRNATSFFVLYIFHLVYC